MNRRTLESTLTSYGVSEIATGNVLKDFDNATDDKAKSKVVNAALKQYKPSVKAASSNKAATGGSNKTEPKRAREKDGTYKGDDPSTPDKNEAYDPPKKTAKKKAQRKKASKKTRKKYIGRFKVFHCNAYMLYFFHLE